MLNIRWSDDDCHFGPFTYAPDKSRSFGLVLKSSDDDDREAYARLHAFGWTLISPLPSWLIRPYRERVQAKYWDAETIARFGRDWYWDMHERQLGFCLSDGSLHLYYGKQTNEWPGSKSRVIFFPWREWRHVRHSLYDLTGVLFANMPDDWDAGRALEASCPTASFRFQDFDGEEITATTRIEEREWRRGVRWFKWLSLVTKPKISRSLDLRFSSEVGKRKGSWKGGTIGHSIEMHPGELHEHAFKRYCAENGLVFMRATKVEGCA